MDHETKRGQLEGLSLVLSPDSGKRRKVYTFSFVITKASLLICLDRILFNSLAEWLYGITKYCHTRKDGSQLLIAFTRMGEIPRDSFTSNMICEQNLSVVPSEYT